MNPWAGLYKALYPPRTKTAPGGGGPVLGPGGTINLAFWYKKGIGVTHNAGVSAVWADQSSFARNLSQSTGANVPAYSAPTWTFDGAAHFMIVSGGFTLIQPTTVCLRVRPITWTSLDTISDGNTASTGRIIQQGVTPDIRMNAGGVSVGPVSPVLGNWTSIVAVFNGASSVLNIDGTEVTGDPGANNMDGFCLGARPDGTSNANFDCVEAFGYSDAKDGATRTALIAYLNTL